MDIWMLMENRPSSDDFCAAHGLSMYIQTGALRILFDFGPNTGFAVNAKTLDFNLAGVDVAVLSHAHQDHGGGLAHFLQTNQTAPVYVSRHAFGDYYAARQKGRVYLGLDKQLAAHPRLVFVDETAAPADGALLFSMPEDAPRPLLPSGNSNLFMQGPNGPVPDAFRHEINLVLTENGQRVLVCGCAHNGVLGIIRQAEALCGAPMDVVLGGFHLRSPDTGEVQSEDALAALANGLLAHKASYYTFHCTGDEAYLSMKKQMGDRLHTLRAGDHLAL